MAAGKAWRLLWYWMWRKGWDYERVKKFGSHARPARTRPWCAVQHRVIDWAKAPLSFFCGEFGEVVIMIKVVTEEMHAGSDRVS